MAKKPNTKTAPAGEAGTRASEDTGKTVMGKDLKPAGEVVEHGNPGAGPGAIEVYQETDYSLIMPDELTDTGYIEIGKKIGHAMEGASWRIGDWCNFGKEKLGYKEYDRLSEITGLSEVYLRTCSSIAHRVKAPFRNLASMERFRLLLAMPVENVVIPEELRSTDPTAATQRAETVPEKVERLQAWTSGELRAKKQIVATALPASASATNGFSNADAPEGTATNQPSNTSTAAGSGAEVGATGKDAATVGTTKPPMTAGRIVGLCRELLEGIEGLTPERITLLAIMEEKTPAVKPLATMVAMLSEQIGDDLKRIAKDTADAQKGK